MTRPALKEPVELAQPMPVPSRPATPLATHNLSVRVVPEIAASYLRAMTERRIAGTAPWTQQDIVAEAMTDWLRKHGYMR